jgi:hypothetical protein
MQLLRWNHPGHNTIRASSMVRGAGCREPNPRLRRREKNVLDMPSIGTSYFALSSRVASASPLIPATAGRSQLLVSPSAVSKATAADSDEATNSFSAVASDTTLGLLDNFTSRWPKTTDRSGVGVRITSKYRQVIRKVGATEDIRRDGHFSIRKIRDGLPCGKGLATHRRVYRIEDTQATDVCNAAHRDRIAQILNLGLRVCERRPRG